MNGVFRWFVRWGLGSEEARVFFSELDELYMSKRRSDGLVAADCWKRKEIRRACFHAVRARLGRRPPVEAVPHSVWFGGLLDGVVRDLTFGLRTLRRRPTFAGVAIGLLGLGIGTFTLTFSLVDGVLLRDLPYEGQGELVKIWETLPEWQGLEGRDEFWDKIGLNWNEFLRLREGTQTLSALAVFRTRTMNLTGGGTPERLDVGEASPDLFPLLGVGPLLGRVLLPGEEGPGAARLAVLSHDLWASRFGLDPDIVGKSIQLDGEPFEVVGVLPRRFRLRSTYYNLFNRSTDVGARALWVPVHFQGTGLGGHDLEGIGRLVEGGTVPHLKAELETLLGEGRSPDRLGFRVTHPREEITGGYRSSLLLLVFSSGILLLIACASIAVLFLSEAMGRSREMATRMALGARRRTIVRQLLTESLLIGGLGALLGLAVAWLGTGVLGKLAPPVPRLEEVGMNVRVLLVAILAGAGTGVIFGLAPVSIFRNRSLRVGSGWGDRGSTGAGGKLQKWFIGAELAFTVVLLVNGGLLTRSLIKLTQVDPGFDAEGVATVHVPLPTTGERGPEDIKTLYREVLDRVRNLPGVERAGAVDGLPFPGLPTGDQFEIVGGDRYITPRDHIMLPGYLETMGIPLLAGRNLSDADVDLQGSGVALINEAMARLYWSDQSPLGARIRQGPLTFEIVGIVGDVPEVSLSAAPLPTVYRCGPQLPEGGMSLVARVDGDPRELVAGMRQAVWSVDPGLPLGQERTLSALLSDSTMTERYRSALVMIFAFLAALVASTGVLGVTAHSVSRRMPEMGIRRTLGATEGMLVRGVVKETMVPSVLGMGTGFVGALAGSRLVEGFVFGIGTWDGLTFWAVAVFLCSLSLLAAALPASRGARVEPMQVLREE